MGYAIAGNQGTAGPQTAVAPQPVAAWKSRRVSIGTTESQLAALAASRGITFKASNRNTGIIYLFDTTGQLADGASTFELRAGETISIEVTNANLVFAIADAAAQILFYGLV